MAAFEAQAERPRAKGRECARWDNSHSLSAYTYDDVVYRVHPSAMTVVTRSVKALSSGSERIMIRPYPPPPLAAVA